MSDPTRSQILAAEFTRPPQPGLRVLAPALIDLGRELGLSDFTSPAERVPRSPREKYLEQLALTWLLDEDIPEDEVYDIMNMGGRPYLFEHVLPGYGRTVRTVKTGLAQAEMALTSRALLVAAYEIMPKPDPAPKAPAPPPNS